MSRSFLDASIPALLKELELDEKIKLLGAPNWWNTHAIERLGIPAVRMSDGPNGVRGSSYFYPTSAQCLPCATSLAATFDADLIREVGIFLAEESKAKSSVILLAPTCNIQRSPVGGRAYESFSEDPHLSGTLSAAIVGGLQSKGIAATIKHLVANDQESERYAADSVMSDRALREIYLYPFMLAQRDSQPWAYMTAYGRIGGVHCSENPELLNDILRKEWKFDGIIMSDWYGTYGVDEALNAGLDLEMPGPPRWRSSLLVSHCLSSQKLLLRTIDTRVESMLKFVQKLAQKNPEIVYGDGVERTRDLPESRAFCRKLAADGLTLLKNESNLLPITPEKVKKVAVIGPAAKGRVISGGGSAALQASYIITPWEGLVANVPKGIELSYAVGCEAHKFLPSLENSLTTTKGEKGWVSTFYNQDSDGNLSDVVLEAVIQNTLVKFSDFLPEGLTRNWTLKLRGLLTVDTTGPFELGLAVAGRAKLWVNDKLIIDNWTTQTNGDFMYAVGTVEERAVIDMTAGKSVEVFIEYTNTTPPGESKLSMQRRTAQPGIMLGLRFGGKEKLDADQAIEDAVRLASESDAVILVGGLTPEWECEGFDRPSLALPGRQDELISRVGAANPNTVVCIQSGSAVSMPWVNTVNGILQCWYSGNEAGNALADVVYGVVNPSGRLPLTLPIRIEDNPAHLNIRSENGKIHYREDLFVGYKHYQEKNIKPLFPFGFGLSYTTFKLSDLIISKPSATDSSIIFDVSVTVTNTGKVTGSEAVQLYVSLPDIGITTPRLQLRGFGKAKDIEPGKSKSVTIKLTKYALSYWDTPLHVWSAAAGTYEIFAGTSSEELPLYGAFELEEPFEWSGL